tara:strand:+ start:632 stop:2227 length:1596 start_codon:yes stop_codon:yes gene_type:complete
MRKIALLSTALIFYVPSAFTSEFQSSKFYSNKEFISTSSITSYTALTESIKTRNNVDSFKFNDITIKKKGELTWEITNNTPIPTSFFPVKVDTLDGLKLISSNEEVPAFSSAIVSINGLEADKLDFVYQSNIFLPKVTLGPYDSEACQSPQDKQNTCYSFPDSEQKITIQNMIALTHSLSNSKQYSELLTEYMENRCTSKPSKCGNYADAQLPYGIRNLLALGGQDHNLALKVMRNKYRSEGVGGGRGVKLNQFLTNTGGWASTWHSILTPSQAYSTRFYRTWLHEIGHAHGFNHSSGMTYGFADYFAEQIIPQLTTEEERQTILPYRSPTILLDFQKEGTSDIEGNSKINLNFLSDKIEISEVDFQVITSCDWEKTIVNSEGNISLLYKKIPNCPVFVRVSDVNSDIFSTIKLSRHDFSQSKSYDINNKKFTVLDSELLNQNDNGWDIRNKCRLPNKHLATKEEYQELWNYLSKNELLDTLDYQQFLSSDGPRSYYIWQLTFDENKMKSNRYRMKNKIGTSNGLVCVSDH